MDSSFFSKNKNNPGMTIPNNIPKILIMKIGKPGLNEKNKYKIIKNTPPRLTGLYLIISPVINVVMPSKNKIFNAGFCFIMNELKTILESKNASIDQWKLQNTENVKNFNQTLWPRTNMVNYYLEYNSTISCSLIFSGIISRVGTPTTLPAN